MTNKEKVWVALAVVTAAVTSFAIAEYKQERQSIVPIPDLPAGSTNSEIEVGGDRYGRVIGISGSTITLQLDPVLGGEMVNVDVDTATVPLLMTSAPSGQGERGMYAQENPATLADFNVGDRVSVRYDRGAELNAVMNVLKITFLY